ncbi:MAG TPA: glycerophosphodiester phosphodiesterase family protein [Candidatus Hydrogenedens sp.]|nr:glycerophosphodiester phosphodiesterase family protein [Candidatus Hydrogenedens sp.]
MRNKHSCLLLILIGISILISTFTFANDIKMSQENVKLHKTKIAAHRGGKALYPENTIYAYQQTVSRWKNCLLEGDVQITADNVAVIIHDDTVDRITNGQGLVREKTLEEIKSLDAAYKFTTDGGQTFPLRGKDITIPTLDELLEAFPNNVFLFEIKPAAENIKPIVEPIIKRNMQEQVYLASVKPQIIQKIRSEYPQIKTCITITDSVEFLSALRSNNWSDYISPAKMLAINEGMEKSFKITNEEMKKIKEKGIQILVFTINQPEKIKKYLQSEVDWILSDYPDRIAQLEAEL